MDYLAAFGLLSVTAMLVCYALEQRSAWFILGFAAACALGSIYGFLQGAWPFGLVEFVWAIVAARRWWLAWTCPSRNPLPHAGENRRLPAQGDDRVHEFHYQHGLAHAGAAEQAGFPPSQTGSADQSP
jgi:hypothetical protein